LSKENNKTVLVHAISQTLATQKIHTNKEGKKGQKIRFMSVDSTNLCPLLYRKRERERARKDSVD